jgi:hypothetical protein
VYTSLPLVLFSVLPYPGSESGLQSVLWFGRQMRLHGQNYVQDWLQISVSSSNRARPNGSVEPPCVTVVLLAVDSNIVYGQRYTYILFCTTKPARSIETRFVSRRFYACIMYFQHCCLVSQLFC